MKTHLKLFTVAMALCVGMFATIAADKKHDHQHIATPKGGRVLDKTKPLAEFVVEKDRSVTIYFYDEKLKPVPAADQTATVQADAKSGKVKFDLEKKGDVLVSSGKLPEGDGYNIVVQFKPNITGKPQNFRFKLDLSLCGECKRAEYGCTCDH